MGAPPTPTAGQDPVIRVDAKPPDWEQIAAAEEAGRTKGGFWKRLFFTMVDALQAAVAKILVALFSLGGFIIKSAVEVIIQVEDTQGQELREIAALAIQDLFNLPEKPRVGGRGIKGGVSSQDRTAIGQAILNSLLGNVAQFSIINPRIDPPPPAGSPASITPPAYIAPSKGLENAVKLLDTVANIAIEGWYEGMIIESASIGFIHGFTELDDTLANILGLGRLVRTGLRPYIEAAVSTPLEWHLNRITQPRLFGPAEAARAVARKVMTREAYFEEMARQGWSPARADHLLAVNSRSPGLADIADFVRFRALTFEEGKKLLTDDAWQPEVAELLLRTEIQKKLGTLRDRIANTAISQYADRVLRVEDLVRTLVAVDYTPEEVELARALGDLLRATPRQLSIGQISEALSDDLIDLATVRDWIDDQGYSERDSLILEQLLLKRKLDDDERDRRRKERLERERSPNRN